MDFSTYPVHSLDDVIKLNIEQMGSKSKFWVLYPETQDRWLFKYARPNTGEDWAEKIASEIAALLDLPHAKVELATRQQEKGTLSLDFTDNRRKGDLVHGNELLVEIDDTYPQNERYRVSQHSVANIARAISQDFVTPSRIKFFPHEVCAPTGIFLGYLMLDALIGNTDRHHENWGLLVRSEGGKRVAELAPTFDHASSLGRELTDEKARAYLLADPRDKNAITVEKYADKAKSAIYVRTGEKPLNPLEAFRTFLAHAEDAGRIWLDRLAQTTDDIIQIAVERVPLDTLGSERKEFIGRFLRHNRRKLLDTEIES